MSRPRTSVVLKRHYQKHSSTLSLEEHDLASQLAYRGDSLTELRRAARSMNTHIRSAYQPFIKEVGRNIFPVIIFTDHEADGPTGVGSTLTLYKADGSVTQVSPALHSNYELYKCCGHLFMGLSVEVGPYVLNPSPCSSFNEANGCIHNVSWRKGLTEYVQHVQIFRQALDSASEETNVVQDMGKLTVDEQDNEDGPNKCPCSNGDDYESSGGSDDTGEDEDEYEKDSSSPYILPPREMRDTMNAMCASVIEFCTSCLASGKLDIPRWKELNSENFPRIKQCMKAATKAQADACIRQIVEWKDMMGPREWRELYVVIPTVWAVGEENPRQTMFSQLMDEDRVDTHIITTEAPRDHSEARTLLGRVVGDRAIGRFVFGDETKEQKIKTMGLSSEVDVVQDDALPAIWDALEANGCPVRPPRRSSDVSLGFLGTGAGNRRFSDLSMRSSVSQGKKMPNRPSIC